MLTSLSLRLFLLLSLSASCTTPDLQPAVEEVVLPYAVAGKPACTTKPPVRATTPARTQGMNKAQQALAEARDALSSAFWDYRNLDNPRDMTLLLRLFSINKRALKLKQIKIAGKDAAAIHQELLTHGFYHKRIALVVNPAEQPKRYWQRDGQTTTNRQAGNLVPLDLYTYVDGSLVKVKPEGTPDGTFKTPRPQPHVSLSVLSQLETLCDADNRCELDMSYDNEAFKVTLAGLPVPKAPGPGLGFRHLHPTDGDDKAGPDEAARRDEDAGWTDTIMSAVHVDLPTDYSHCKK